jgi:hypothetical protein
VLLEGVAGGEKYPSVVVAALVYFSGRFRLRG